MARLTVERKMHLEEMFADRVTFDKTERKLYSHDIGELPRLIQPLVGKSLADAVVQPGTERELIDLVNWAGENNIPLTPRGKATSGYGGVLPIKGGVVVDFHHMNATIGLSPDSLTATVQAGKVWNLSIRSCKSRA